MGGSQIPLGKKTEVKRIILALKRWRGGRRGVICGRKEPSTMAMFTTGGGEISLGDRKGGGGLGEGGAPYLLSSRGREARGGPEKERSEGNRYSPL